MRDVETMLNQSRMAEITALLEAVGVCMGSMRRLHVGASDIVRFMACQTQIIKRWHVAFDENDQGSIFWTNISRQHFRKEPATAGCDLDDKRENKKTSAKPPNEYAKACDKPLGTPRKLRGGALIEGQLFYP